MFLLILSMKIKKNLVTLLIIITILAFATWIIYSNSKSTGEELVPSQIAQCIGGNATMYSQTGCHFCKQQKDMFGTSVQYLDIIECDQQPSVCNSLGIQGTPTWIINGTKYQGVLSIENLQNLTGCY